MKSYIILVLILPTNQPIYVIYDMYDVRFTIYEKCFRKTIEQNVFIFSINNLTCALHVCFQ